MKCTHPKMRKRNDETSYPYWKHSDITGNLNGRANIWNPKVFFYAKLIAATVHWIFVLNQVKFNSIELILMIKQHIQCRQSYFIFAVDINNLMSVFECMFSEI